MNKCVAALVPVLMTAAMGQHVEGASCKPRRDYEITIKRSGAGKKLLDASNNELGCVLEEKKATTDADLCGKADGESHIFEIAVFNRCDKSIDAKVEIVRDPDWPIGFKGGATCKEALRRDGLTKTIPADGHFEVVCKTDKIAVDPNAESLRAAYRFTVTKVGSVDAANGSFDPEIVIERGGEHDMLTADLFWFWSKVLALLFWGVFGLLGAYLTGRQLERRASARRLQAQTAGSAVKPTQ